MSETPLLIIDDDVKLARLLKDYLTPLGYEVDVVHNGSAGLKKALEMPYAAVILDVMLPGMNGMEVLRELRRVRHPGPDADCPGRRTRQNCRPRSRR